MLYTGETFYGKTFVDKNECWKGRVVLCHFALLDNGIFSPVPLCIVTLLFQKANIYSRSQACVN